MKRAELLTPRDPEAYELVNPTGRSPFVLTCDHAGRVLPERLGDLGVSQSELQRHIAWDLGAAALSRLLAERLDAFLILQTYSRLVIDVNRPPGTTDSIVTLSERTEIPGNRELSESARRAREQEVFAPYHDRIGAEIDRRVAAGGPLVLVSLHSFTPRYKDVARSWHGGILYGRDARFARPVLAHLQRESGLLVGDNEPYAVSDETDYTVVVHGERRAIPYVEIEVRQDLLATPEGQGAWATRLAAALEFSFSALFPS